MASLPLPQEPLLREAAPAPRVVARPALRVVEPGRAPAPAERLDADLPPALIRLMVGAFTTFMAIMAAVFTAPDGMGIVLAICFVCVAGYFGLPYVMVRSGPAAKGKGRSIATLLEKGLELPDGRCGGGEAVGLVLLLPVILILWAVFVGYMHATLF